MDDLKYVQTAVQQSGIVDNNDLKYVQTAVKQGGTVDNHDLKYLHTAVKQSGTVDNHDLKYTAVKQSGTVDNHDFKYVHTPVKQSGTVNNHDLFSAKNTVLPGVHEIIPSYDSTHNKLVTATCYPAYTQPPCRQYLNTDRPPSEMFSHTSRPACQSELSFHPSDRGIPLPLAYSLQTKHEVNQPHPFAYSLQEKHEVNQPDICIPHPFAYSLQGKHEVNQPDRGIPLPFAYSLQEKHEVNRYWTSNQFLQPHHLNTVGVSQWLSDSSTFSKLPGTRYGAEGVSGLQLRDICQTSVLGPIQQPDVQPTPPCFWIDHFKSQSLRPLPRPVSSTLDMNINQIHHVGCNSPLEPCVCPEFSNHFKSQSLRPLPRPVKRKLDMNFNQIHHGCNSPFEPCVCSEFSIGNQAASVNSNTIQSGVYRPSSYNNNLYDISGANKSSVDSKYPSYQTAGSEQDQVPSATVSRGNLVCYSSKCTDRLNENVSFVESNAHMCSDEQKVDENCNHIYNVAVDMCALTAERLEDKSRAHTQNAALHAWTTQTSEDKCREQAHTNNMDVNQRAPITQRVEDKCREQAHTNNMDVNQRAPITQRVEDKCREQAHTNNMEVNQRAPITQRVEDKCRELDDELSTSMIEQYIQSAPDFHSLPQIRMDQSELVISNIDQTRRLSKVKKEMISPQTEANLSRGNDVRKHSKIGEFHTMTKGNVFDKDSVTKACSSSSSEVSPINPDTKPSSHTSTRRRSYRSRNFSKEFCNRWSSFEDVPLVISGKSNSQIVCSTPKKINFIENALNEKRYKCEICGKVFFNHYTYSRHLKRHKVAEENSCQKQTLSKNLYRCSACNMTWFDRNLFISHSQLHMKEVQHSSFTEKSQNINMVNSRELNSRSQMKAQSFVESRRECYVCCTCKDSFSSCHEYKLHCAKHHEIISSESDSSPSVYYSCSVCDVKFVNRFMYSKHCVSNEHRIMLKLTQTRTQKTAKSKNLLHEDLDMKSQLFLRGNSRPVAQQSHLKVVGKNLKRNYSSVHQNKSRKSEIGKLKSRKDEMKLLKSGCPSVSAISKMNRQCFTSDKLDNSNSDGVCKTHSVNNCSNCMKQRTTNSSKLPVAVESLHQKSILMSCLVGKPCYKPTRSHNLFETEDKCCNTGKPGYKPTQYDGLFETQDKCYDSECSVLSEKLSQIKLSSEELSESTNDETFSNNTVLSLQVDANNNLTDITTKCLQQMKTPQILSGDSRFVETRSSCVHRCFNPSVSRNLQLVTSDSSKVKHNTEHSTPTIDQSASDIFSSHGRVDVSISKTLPRATRSPSCFCNNDLSVMSMRFTSPTSIECVKEKKPETQLIMNTCNSSKVDGHNGGHIPEPNDKNVQNKKLQKIIYPCNDVSKLGKVHQLGFSESTQETDDSVLQMDDSGLETSDMFIEEKLNKADVFNCDQSVSSRQNGSTKSDIDKSNSEHKTPLKTDSIKPGCAHLELAEVESIVTVKEDGYVLKGVETVREDGDVLKGVQLVETVRADVDVLKGDSGLWSGDELFTSESDVEGSVLHSHHADDSVLHSSSLNDNVLLSCRVEGSESYSHREDELEEDESEIWSIAIVDSSDKHCKTEVEDWSVLSSEKTGIANGKTVISFQVEYDASSVDSAESRGQMARNNWKIISDFVKLSNDSVPQLNSTPLVANTQDIDKEKTIPDSVLEESSNCKNMSESSLPIPLHHTHRKMVSTPLLLDDIYDNGKLYFCEICGETFLNPFRYSAHYKKKSHIELASDFCYENISLTQTLPTKKKENLKKLKSPKLEKSYKSMKDLKRRTKTIVEKRRRQLSKINVCLDFGTGIARSPGEKQQTNKNTDHQCFTNSYLDHTKKSNDFKTNKVSVPKNQPARISKDLKRRWYYLNRLKKTASSKRLKRLRSTQNIPKPAQYLSNSNCENKTHNKPDILITTESSHLKTDNIMCSCCSSLFLTDKDLQLHMCPKKLKNSIDKSQGNDELHQNTEKQLVEDGDVLKKLDKHSSEVAEKKCGGLKRGLQHEPSSNKRKPVVKCPALLKLLTATDEAVKKEHRILSKPPKVYECIPCKLKFSSSRTRKRHFSCAEHKNCIRNRSSSHIERSDSDLSKPAQQLEQLEEMVQPSTSSTGQTPSMHYAKKLKLSSILPNCSQKSDGRCKLGDGKRKGAQLKKKHQPKPEKNRTVYCNVCEKTYSSTSHLNRHFGTKRHKELLRKTERKLK